LARARKPGNQPQQRGLAAARAADNRQELPGRNGQIEAIENLALAEAFGDLAQGNGQATKVLRCRRAEWRLRETVWTDHDRVAIEAVDPAAGEVVAH
jgi:hypothetical protein